MKRKLVALALALVVICIAVSLAAVSCADRLRIPTSIDFDTDFKTYDKAIGLSAYDLFIDAYNNYVSDKEYSFTEYFDFRAKALGLEVATQQRKIIKKVNGESIYESRVVVGTGQGTEHQATKFYYDGAKAYEINIDDKNRVPNKGKGEEIFNVTDYGKFSDYAGNESELNEEIRLYREKICYYDFSKRAYLSDNHDDNVYEKDGVFYLTISFDSSTSAMNSFNKASKDAFISALGIEAGDEDTLKLLEDSIYKAAIMQIDGKYKFIGMQLTEKYEGKASGFTAKAQNIDSFYFSYSESDCKISDEDIAGI